MGGKAILAASFGTSHPETLAKTIAAIEADLFAAFPQRVPLRAFTSGVIRKVLLERDDLAVPDVPEALNTLVSKGFDDILIQPTFLMHGEEFSKLEAQAGEFQRRHPGVRLALGRPLLSQVRDYREVAEVLMSELPSPQKGKATLYMGHGSPHFANPAFCQLDYLLHDLGRRDVFVATVQGYPTIDEGLRRLKEHPEVREIDLRLLLVVAGNHAKKDLIGDRPTAWKTILEQAGYTVTAHLTGLGENPMIRRIFLRHAAEAEEIGLTN